MSEFDRAKLELLEQVFSKALDVSINSIGENDLQECFGDIKNDIGASLQRSFVNIISKTEKRIEESFKNLNKKYHVIDLVISDSSEPVKPSKEPVQQNESDDLIGGLEDDMTRTVMELKAIEINELNNAIKTLENEIKKSKDSVNRLRTQMINEVEALKEESLKMKNATEEFTMDTSS